ncbi:MAG: ABC transporter permease, partial [Ilumatobacteraceae bacterium]
IVEGRLAADGAVVSAEAANALNLGIGDTLTVTLPDDSTIDLAVTGIADLSRSRSLFSSRRGGDLETFIYSPNSIIVSPTLFDSTVHPAYDRASTIRGTRLKSPPIREVDLTLERHLLDADPGTAAVQTQRIGAAVTAVAANQDYLLDNISNTLAVATADARVAKRLFVFLGVPGGFLAAMLAAYAGTVLAEAQRREQATLRIRGASRRHLLRMLAVRTCLITAVGSVVGLVIGYGLAAAILGRESLSRASSSALITSALIGTISGFIATGFALYVTGRRSIDREINEDRNRLALRPPLWRRARLDIIGVAVVVAGTVIALRNHAFDGAPGSVYFGRAVELNLALLVLPVAVWITGSLVGARLIGTVLTRTQPQSTASIGRPLPSLIRLSIGRRPWAIGNGAIIVALIVALATSLAGFTASYDAAKVDDSRYANGADIRITPSPVSVRPFAASDARLFLTEGVAGTTPVVYGLSNVILRSARTSDPANLAAIDPDTYVTVAPLADTHVRSGDARSALLVLRSDPTAVLLSKDMALFLKAKPGDPLFVLLARATDDQVEIELHVTNVFERLPGFPDGVDAVMSIDQHTAQVPAKAPDFFLAATAVGSDAGLRHAVESLRRGPAATDPFQIDTRITTLARDQSSLAALNIAGLVDLDSTFSLTMAAVTIAIFVFGLLLQRRREYITLRAQGLESGTIRLLITLEAATAAITGAITGLIIGAAMGFYFVTVLRPLFVLPPSYTMTFPGAATPVALLLVATLISSAAASRLVNRLEPTELLRDE